MKRLEFFLYKANTVLMDAEQAILVSSNLLFTAIAAFFAILLWPRIRDPAWMLIIFGVIVTYIETVYSVLKYFGISGNELMIFGNVPLVSLTLPVIRMSLFIAAFTIMIYRQSRQK